MADIKSGIETAGKVAKVITDVAAVTGGINIRAGANQHKVGALLKRNKIKPIGRVCEVQGKMSGFWSACGFEINLCANSDCSLRLLCETNDIVYLAVYVDGVKQERANAITAEMGDLYVALEKGEHTVRIVRDTQINKEADKYFYYCLIEFDGKILKRPFDNEFYIEIIGDSIACGDGALGVYEEGKAWKNPEDHSAVAGFAYKLAEDLCADYSIVARGGIGLLKDNSGSQESEKKELRTTMQDIYGFTNGYFDMERKQNRYKFRRKPDLIILELSGNDITAKEDEWKACVEDFIKTIRKENGKSVPIIWSGRNKIHAETINTIIEEGKIKNFYACKYLYGGSGSAALTTQKSGHPSAAEQTEISDNLLKFINSNGLLKRENVEVTITDEQEKIKARNKKITVGTIVGAIAITGAAVAAITIIKKKSKKINKEKDL